jgi:hypothetical protein
MRVTHSYVQKIVAPPDEVFPLICPVREADWLDDWEYKLVYSESGLAEKGCIFTTQHAGEPETVWIITRHDSQAGIVEFNRVTPGWLVVHLQVRMEDGGGGTTAARITYTYTALSEMGRKAIEHHHSEEQFNQMVTWWEKSMNHYLQTGERLKAHGH